MFAPKVSHNDAPDDAIQQRHRKLRRRLGLNPHQPIESHADGAENLLWPRIRALFQEGFSEFLGCMIMTLVYQGALA